MNLELETIVKFYKFKRLPWAGYVEIMPDVMTPKVMTKWVSQWKRHRSKPNKRWIYCVEDDKQDKTEGGLED